MRLALPLTVLLGNWKVGDVFHAYVPTRFFAYMHHLPVLCQHRCPPGHQRVQQTTH